MNVDRDKADALECIMTTRWNAEYLRRRSLSIGAPRHPEDYSWCKVKALEAAVLTLRARTREVG